jgi:hypothetical protein
MAIPQFAVQSRLVIIFVEKMVPKASPSYGSGQVRTSGKEPLRLNDIMKNQPYSILCSKLLHEFFVTVLK